MAFPDPNGPIYQTMGCAPVAFTGHAPNRHIEITTTVDGEYNLNMPATLTRAGVLELSEWFIHLGLKFRERFGIEDDETLSNKMTRQELAKFMADQQARERDRRRDPMGGPRTNDLRDPDICDCSACIARRAMGISKDEDGSVTVSPMSKADLIERVRQLLPGEMKTRLTKLMGFLDGLLGMPPGEAPPRRSKPDRDQIDKQLKEDGLVPKTDADIDIELVSADRPLDKHDDKNFDML